MNNKVKKNKNATLIYIIVAIVLALFIGIKIGNYESPKKKDEFTIRVFDSITDEEIFQYKNYKYEYTGEPIDFIIKIYCNGKEIYKRSFLDLYENQGKGSFVNTSTLYSEFYNSQSQNFKKIPIDRGFYIYDIYFNCSYLWNGDYISNALLDDFEFSFYIDYDYYKSTNEG